MSVYSETDPDLEQRLLQVRNNPSNRVKLMGKQRISIGRQHLRMEDIELQWIIEDAKFSELIPVLEPCEYWALILTLTQDLKEERGKQ